MWDLVYSWLGCVNIVGTSVEDLLEYHCNQRCGVDKKVWNFLWFSTVWNIWLSRNALVFKSEEISPTIVFEKIQLCSWSWLKGKGKLRG